MKKILILLSLIIFSKIGSSQFYKSVFGKNLTTWSIYAENLDIKSAGNYHVFSDTIFNGQTYKKIYVYDYSEANVIIREDTMTGKVWIYNFFQACNSPQEQLAFNMSLQLGDTFNTSFSYLTQPNPADTLIVVDSVYYVQGQKCIRFATPAWASYLPEPITFIEGIGPNYSLLWINDNCTTDLSKYLLCVFKDSVQANYTNLRFDGQCYPDFTEVKEVGKGVSGLYISPNPATNQLTISATNFQPQTITIYDLNGRQVKNLPFAHEIDISILPPGVYVVEVTGKEATEMGKLVKM